ncbi:MAG: HesA/MoeB/ThiF family protein [Candidatus Margulisiibacteriota bacterium]
MVLTEEQLERYRRQMLLPQIDQEKLLSAKVLVVGAGGLGSPVSYYLAGAGVGTIGIVDPEAVELSNLHRQILYTTDDIGKKKVWLAKDRLEKINHDIAVVPYAIRLTSENIEDIMKDYDIIIDCSDNFPTRYLVNDACVKTNKAFVHGAVFRTEGQVMVVKPGEGPCYRCVFPEEPGEEIVSSAQRQGVLGATAGIIGLIQATEAIKLILETGKSLVGQLIVYNAMEMSFRKVNVSRAQSCSCG